MSKILKSYRFDERTLEKLEFIVETREKLDYYGYDRTSIIELLIWNEADRLRILLEKEEEREP